MLKKIVFLVSVTLLFLASGGTASSRQTDPYWYFAFNDVEFISFASDGTSGAVLPKNLNAPNTEESYIQECYQVGPQTALITSDRAWYLLTPTSSIPLPISTDITSQPMYLAPGYGPYSVFLWDVTRAFLLFNAETGAVEQLTGESSDQYRFSEDGRYFYYSSLLDGTWALRERELATGTERVIFSWQSGDITPDNSGKYWLYHVYQAREGIDVFTVVSINGEQWEVGQFAQQERLTVKILDNALVTYHPRGCQPNCEFNIQTLPDGPQQTFVVSNVNDTSVIPELYSFMDGSELLLSIGDTVWLVPPTGEPTQIGFTFENMGVSALWTDDDRLVITDAHLAQGETGVYTIWDRQTNDYVWRGSYDTSLWWGWWDFYPYSWLLFEDMSVNQAILYLYQTGKLVRLPSTPNSRYFGVTQLDGKTLYGQFWEYGDMDAGIYLYDPASEAYQLLTRGEELRLCPVIYQPTE